MMRFLGVALVLASLLHGNAVAHDPDYPTYRARGKGQWQNSKGEKGEFTLFISYSPTWLEDWRDRNYGDIYVSLDFGNGKRDSFEAMVYGTVERGSVVDYVYLGDDDHEVEVGEYQLEMENVEGWDYYRDDPYVYTFEFTTDIDNDYLEESDSGREVKLVLGMDDEWRPLLAKGTIETRGRETISWAVSEPLQQE